MGMCPLIVLLFWYWVPGDRVPILFIWYCYQKTVSLNSDVYCVPSLPLWVMLLRGLYDIAGGAS